MIATVPDISPQTAEQQHSRVRRPLPWWYAFCLILAVFTYFYALGSEHIPKNGDEYVYAHITRLTAASGQLRQLVSQQIDMRATKPPLLFWQGIASTHWARDWSLFNLRYPSVFYTLGVALMAFLLGRKLSGQLELAVLSALIYLSFFNTYRYGRPFLTEAPMSFWTFFPIFLFLYLQPATLQSSFWAPALMGLVLGVALLYKSFVLVLPVALALSWWYLTCRGFHLGEFLKKDAWRIAITVIVALALFSVWFLLDPNPASVFQEFVLKENVGRFDVAGQGYLHRLFWGVSSIWGLALGIPVNAGLLIFPVFALFGIAFKRRGQWDASEKMLWIWPASLFLIFSLPSMRSDRYLLPASPAIAVLCALYWNRIGRRVFVATLILATAALGGLAYLSIRLQLNLTQAHIFPFTYWLLLAFTAGVILCALLAPEFTRPAIPGVALLVSLTLACAIRPLDGPLGTFTPQAQQYVSGKQVWVPCNFRAVDEGYRFLLPNADVHGYRDDKSLTPSQLDSRYPIFAFRQRLSAPNPEGLNLVGERLELRSRHTNRELLDMLRGNVFNQLFLRELLVEVPGASPVADPDDSGCR